MNINHYRNNVAMVVANGMGQVLLAERCDQTGWQFPQGGIEKNESCEQALYRELYEEVGLDDTHVRPVASTATYLCYVVPKHLRKARNLRAFVGQRQRWFLLLMTSTSDVVNLNTSLTPEFRSWCWVPYWYALNSCVAFKRDIYTHALCLLADPHARLCREGAK